jgi:hypothetical protein
MAMLLRNGRFRRSEAPGITISCDEGQYTPRMNLGAEMAGIDGINNRLDRPVDDRNDHMLDPHHAPITLVEYGNYRGTPA